MSSSPAGSDKDPLGGRTVDQANGGISWRNGAKTSGRAPACGVEGGFKCSLTPAPHQTSGVIVVTLMAAV